MSLEYSEPLPYLEWNFEKLVDQDQIDAAFFYEYSRESMGIKKLVEEWQRLKSNPLNLFKEEPSRVTEIQQLPFFSGIDFLALFPDCFPKKPIQEIQESKEEYFFIALKELFYPKPRIHRIENYEHVELKFSLKNGSYLPPYENTIFLDPDYVNLVISVPKQLHRSALEKSLIQDVLETCRQDIKTVLHANKIGMKGLPLGFDKRAALDWLSVLRRFKACGFTYKRYFGEYGFGKNVDSSESQLREKKRKASEIVKWFDSGGLGKIVSKDKGRSIVWDGEGITK